MEWSCNIKPPKEVVRTPERVTIEDIRKTLEYFKEHKYRKQAYALIHLGMDTGMRSQELYQLQQDDIDLENRTVQIIHNPDGGKTTKTARSRVSFFTPRTREIIEDYLEYFNNGCDLKHLFSKKHMQRLFSGAPLHVKYLRKYFSSEWERRNGNHQVKQRLMGHSLRGVDAKHYSYVDESDLKKIYDKVLN